MKIKQFINYIYYFIFSIFKNTYPCKLVGEKIDVAQNKTTILYKYRGQQEEKTIFLQDLLNQKNLIEKFNSIDAAKLGALSLFDIISVIPINERKEKFNKIKNIMLDSLHDVYPKNLSHTNTFLQQVNFHENGSDYFHSLIINNKYRYKLVGWKTNYSNYETIIIFTISGKREGYEKPLNEIISNKNILENFHPTEAVKFGFIAQGEDSLHGQYFNKNGERNDIKFA